MTANNSGIFAGTYEGVYSSSNNGTNWNVLNNGLSNTNVLTLATSGTCIFAGTNGGGVFLSNDNRNTLL